MGAASPMHLLEQAARLGHWSYRPRTQAFESSLGTRLIMDIQTDAPGMSLNQWFDRFVPGSRERLGSAVQFCLLRGASFDLQLQVIRADGAKHHVQVIGEAEYEGGQLLSVSGVLLDIHARHDADLKSQRRMAESEQRYRASFDALAQLTALLKPDGTVVEINEAAVEMCGAGRRSIVGQRMWMTPWWTHSGDVQMQLHAGVECAAAGDLVCFEVDIMGAAGPVTVELSIKPIFDARGRVEFLIAEARDISERRRLAETLRRSDSRFRMTFDQAPHGMAVVGLDGRCLMANRALSEVLGYSRIELLAGMNFQQITHSADLEAERVLVQRLLAGEIDTFRVRKRYLHKSGHAVLAQLHCALMRDDEGEPSQFILQIKDLRGSVQAHDSLTAEFRQARA